MKTVELRARCGKGEVLKSPARVISGKADRFEGKSEGEGMGRLQVQVILSGNLTSVCARGEKRSVSCLRLFVAVRTPNPALPSVLSEHSVDR